MTRFEGAVAVLVALVVVVSVTTGAGATAVHTTEGSAAMATPVSGCTTISSPGVYELGSDVDTTASSCINVTASDVVFDGQGNTINMSGTGDAVNVSPSGSYSNVTVQELTVRNASRGVFADVPAGESASDLTVEGIVTRDMGSDAIFVDVSDNAVLAGLRLADSDLQGPSAGLEVFSDNTDTVVSDVTIENNVIDVDSDGIEFDSDDSSGTDVRDVRVLDNRVTTDSEGVLFLADADNDTVENVRIERNDVDSTAGSQGIEFDVADPGGVARNVTVADNTVASDDDGIEFEFDDSDVTAEGIRVRNNTIDAQGGASVYVQGDGDRTSVTDFRIEENFLGGSGFEGVEFDADNDNNTAARVSIRNNTVRGPEDGLEFDLNGDDAVYDIEAVGNDLLSTSDGVLISDIQLFDQRVVDVDIRGNRITGSFSDGIDLDLDPGTTPTGTLTVERNEIRGDATADVFDINNGPPDGVVISRNAIVGATVAYGDEVFREPIFTTLNTESGQFVDARRNYWNASNGPNSSGPFEDPVTGELADGDGVEIATNASPGVSNFRFDPFRRGTVAVTNNSNPAPLPDGRRADTSPLLAVSQGVDAPVADVSWAFAGELSAVAVDLRGDQGTVPASRVRSVRVTAYNDSTGSLGSASAAYDSHNTTVSFGGVLAGVDRVVVRAQLEDNVSQGSRVDAAITLIRNPTSGGYDTVNFLEVDTTNTGFISGRVSDQNNTDIENATVTFRSTDGTIVKNTTTDSEGDYTVELQPGTYNATVRKPGFSTAQAKDLQVESNKTTTANFVIRRLRIATTLEATPDSATGIVNETVTITVTVRDQDGDRLSGVDVVGAESDPNVRFVGGSSGTTDDQGEVTFTLTSNATVAEVPVTFTAQSGGTPSDTSLVSFVQSGEGSIVGTILSDATTDPVENASVWTVQQSVFRQNTFETQLNVTTLGDDDGVVFFRLIDNSSGAVLEVGEDYRVQTPNGSDTAIRPLSALNTTNESVGEGFAVIDQDGDGNVTFGHTRLAPEDYYAQVSLTAPNNSDIDELGDEANPPENFANVTVGGSLAVFEPSANLTLEATVVRARTTGANQVDAPGFVNTYGEDTGGTNVNGQFKLTELFSDFQEGRTYTVIATKAGFSTEYGEVYVTEDGAKFTNSPFQGLNLEPEPREPAQVNITQVGTHPDEAYNASLVDRFAEVNEVPGDDEFQAIPRDGTIDVMNVTVLDESGDPINGTVRIDLSEYDDSRFADADSDDLTGEFLAVLGGTNESGGGPGSDTITISVGDDGEARVLYQSVESNGTVRVNKTATVTTDQTVRDHSNATFVGVLVINETGSLSGLVTNQNNEPLPSSTVWTQEFQVKGRTLRLEPAAGSGIFTTATPVDLLEANWTITYVPTGRTATVKGYTLTTSDIDDRIYGAAGQPVPAAATDGLRELTGIPGVSLQERAEEDGLTLLTFASETASGQYTLPRVPADRDAVGFEGVGALYPEIRAVQLNQESPVRDGIGDSIAEGVQPNQTQEANVVIPEATPTRGVVTLDVSAPSTVEQGETFDVDVTLENQDLLDSAVRDVELRLDNGTSDTGDDVVLTREDVGIAAGGTETVTFTVSVPGDARTGNQSLAVSTDVAGEISTRTLTVEAGGAGGVVDDYDENDDGGIDTGELQTAIGDWAAGSLSTQDLNTIIQAWAGGS